MVAVFAFGSLCDHALTNLSRKYRAQPVPMWTIFRFAVRQMPRLRAQFSDNPLVQQMARIAERTICYYGGDFISTTSFGCPHIRKISTGLCTPAALVFFRLPFPVKIGGINMTCSGRLTS